MYLLIVSSITNMTILKKKKKNQFGMPRIFSSFLYQCTGYLYPSTEKIKPHI